MAVQVLLNEELLWESAAPSGLVVINIDQSSLQGQPLAVPSELYILPMPATQLGQIPMVLDYLIDEALFAELLVDTRISRSVANLVEKAIVCLLGTMKANLSMRSRNHEGYSNANHKINEGFRSSSNIVYDHC